MEYEHHGTDDACPADHESHTNPNAEDRTAVAVAVAAATKRTKAAGKCTPPTSVCAPTTATHPSSFAAAKAEGETSSTSCRSGGQEGP